MFRTFLFFLVGGFLLSLGCQKQKTPPKPTHEVSRLAASQLTVLVVNDPLLASGIKLLRGEWAERTGGQIDLEQSTLDQLLDASELSADIIIFPSRHIGTLVDRDWLRPVRKSVLQSEDLALNDLLPVVRNATMRYGSQVYALSRGEPPLMLAEHAGSEHFVHQQTWQQFEIPFLHAKATAYPHVAEWIARVLAMTHPGYRRALLFDAGSMQPKISSPVFVRALEEMVQLETHAPDRRLKEFNLACPPTRNHLPMSGLPDPPWTIAFRSLPLAEQVYNPIRGSWEPAVSSVPITILGFSGRSVSVTRSTRNSASAFKFLTWIISESVATQLSPRSQATVWFRKSQVRQADKWLERSRADDESASSVTMLLSSDYAYLIPRIPGIDDYLQALEKAIQRAVLGVLSAEEVLAEIEEQWNTLTDRYNRDRQRVSYRKHLGLDLLQPVVKNGQNR